MIHLYNYLYITYSYNVHFFIIALTLKLKRNNALLRYLDIHFYSRTVVKKYTANLKEKKMYCF